MTTPAVYDFEAIRRHQEEIEAEQKLALTGSSAPKAQVEAPIPTGISVEGIYGDYAIGWRTDYGI
jgi:hypothetical protein